jgi:hypothetical protein
LLKAALTAVLILMFLVVAGMTGVPTQVYLQRHGTLDPKFCTITYTHEIPPVIFQYVVKFLREINTRK